MSNQRDRKAIWNHRHQTNPGWFDQPGSFLVHHVKSLKPGSVMDLACGTGRNSIYLAQQGFEVISIDFSNIALNTLKSFSLQNNLNIETIEMDLGQKGNVNALSKADNIVVVHYKLEDGILDQIPSLLHENGIFLYYTFNRQHAEKRKFNQKFCLSPGELVDKKWQMKLLKYSSFENDSGHHDGYLFKKTAT